MYICKYQSFKSLTYTRVLKFLDSFKDQNKTKNKKNLPFHRLRMEHQSKTLHSQRKRQPTNAKKLNNSILKIQMLSMLCSL